MRGQQLGEREELVLLTVGVLINQAYAVLIAKSIKSHTGRTIDVTSIHSVLRRLEKKGYVTSEMKGAIKERGGRRKRYFSVTTYGRKLLDEKIEQRLSLYQKLP